MQAQSMKGKDAASIGDYVLGKTIGVGATGRVRVAVHTVTEQKVAIKILDRRKISKDDPTESKLRSEIDILSMVYHPHIIRLYEVIESPTKIYLVMEYVSKGELFDYIVSRGRLPEVQARRFFQQLISAIEYCHSNEIAHRDLKPENILLESSSCIKLADFGYSHVMQDGGFLKTSCGSPNYAAPELLSAEIYAGPEVDIWSSGVILYTMLCAKLPFDDAYDNMRNLFRLIRSGTYTIPSYVSPMATDLIKRILVVDPLKRLSIKDIKNHPWFSVRVPLYINVPFERSAFRKGTIDQLALDQVCQDFAVADRQGLLEWVQMGAPVITDQRLSRHVRERRLVVCYRIFQTLNLTNLHKADASLRTAEDGKQPKTDNDTTEGGGKQVLLNSLLSEDNIGPARAFEMLSISDLSKAVVSTDRPVQKTLPQPFVSSTPGPTLVPGRKFGDDGHWRVGLWTTSDPRIVMHHIYAALKALSYEWKIVSSYDFKVRAIMNGNNVMFVAARYRLYRSHRKRDLPKHSVGHLPMHYVLDISLRAGTAMAFLIHVNRVQQALERHVDLSIAKPPPALKIMG